MAVTRQSLLTRSSKEQQNSFPVMLDETKRKKKMDKIEIFTFGFLGSCRISDSFAGKAGGVV